MRATTTSVTFRSDDLTLAGNLFVPDSYESGRGLPAVVCAAPASGVKEQVAGLYAAELSAQGFVALAFDYASYGESEGEPRFHENPHRKMEDIKNAISYIRTRPEVDRDRVFNLGVCMGSAYSAYATATDGRVKAFAAASPIFNVKEQQLLMYGGTSGVRETLKVASEARQTYYETGRQTHFPPLPEDSETLPEQMREMIGYYNTGRGDHPNWNNQTLAWSTETMLAFSAAHCVDLLEPVPVFMTYGDQAVTLQNNEEIYDAIGGEKDRFVVQGATHFDFYWKEEFVQPAVDRIATFYRRFV